MKTKIKEWKSLYVPQIIKPCEDAFCGNCNSFIDEDSEGLGWCAVYDWRTMCNMWCEEWEHKMDMP